MSKECRATICSSHIELSSEDRGALRLRTAKSALLTARWRRARLTFDPALQGYSQPCIHVRPCKVKRSCITDGSTIIFPPRCSSATGEPVSQEVGVDMELESKAYSPPQNVPRLAPTRSMGRASYTKRYARPSIDVLERGG